MAASTWNSLLLIMFPMATMLLISLSRSCSADTNMFWSGGNCTTTTPADPANLWSTNLKSAFNYLAENVSSSTSDGYCSTEAGEDPEKAFALIQCRGDLSPAQCGECTRESFKLAAQYCGGSTTGIIVQTWCYLRYSDTSFHGTWEGSGGINSWLPANSTGDDPTVDDEGIKMMSQLVVDASNDNLLFAASATEDSKRYGLAQCTRDLGQTGCASCLDSLFNRPPRPHNDSVWKTWSMGCFMLYDDNQFYFTPSSTRTEDNNTTDGGLGTPPPPLPRPDTDTDSNASNRGLGGGFGFGTTILPMAAMLLVSQMF